MLFVFVVVLFWTFWGTCFVRDILCVGRQAGGHVDVLPLVADAHFVCDLSLGGQAMAPSFFTRQNACRIRFSEPTTVNEDERVFYLTA